jgi:hypothetical protein
MQLIHGHLSLAGKGRPRRGRVRGSAPRVQRRSLAGRVGMPSRARAGLEPHHARAYVAGRRRLDNRILPDGAVEIVGRRAARGRRAGWSLLAAHFSHERSQSCAAQVAGEVVADTSDGE